MQPQLPILFSAIYRGPIHSLTVTTMVFQPSDISTRSPSDLERAQEAKQCVFALLRIALVMRHKTHLSYEQKPCMLLSMKYWLVYRDPRTDLLQSPYNWVV